MQGEPTTPLKSLLLIVNKLVPHSENNQTPTGLKPWKNLNPFLYKIWTLFLFETLGMRLWVWPLEQTPVWWLKPIPSLNGLTQPIWCCRLDSGWLSMLLHVLHPVMTCSLHLWQAKGAVRETAPCVSSCAISCNSPKINGELARRLCLVNCDSKWCKAPKALCLVRFINLSRVRACFTCWSLHEAETRVVNISIDLLGVCSWPYPVVTLGAWHSGQGSIFTYSKFGGSESKSWQSHTFLTCAFFPFSFFIIFFPFACFSLFSLVIL